MSVDISKSPHVILVHGVRIGTDNNITLDKDVSKLIRNVLSRSHVKKSYEVLQYRYEDMNNSDPSVKLANLIATTFMAKKPLAGKALRVAIDLIGDVVIASSNNSTAGRIRNGLKDRILSSHEKGHRVLIVAHSLGSYYALQVINELMNHGKLFSENERRMWAVQGLVSLGSPLGLDFNILGTPVFPRITIRSPRNNQDLFPWYNFFSPYDPVVSGRLFGRRIKPSGTDGPVEQRYRRYTEDNNWLLFGNELAVGNGWLMAHTRYWKDLSLGVRIVSMLWG